MRTSTGAPTKAQAARFVAIKLDTGCVCCRIKGLGYVQPDIHHLTLRKRCHDETIGLCPWHHRGYTEGRSVAAFEDMFGPSLAQGSKPFHAAFGSDEQLLAYQNELLSTRKAA